jgi:hypothetical protein
MIANQYPAAQCFKTEPHGEHTWGEYAPQDKYTKHCSGIETAAEKWDAHFNAERDRELAVARVAAWITAPSWSKSPYAGQQAKDLIALVLDVTPCRSMDPNSTLFDHVCYREQGHEGKHFADGGYAWDTEPEEDWIEQSLLGNDVEMEQRHQDEIDKSIADHEQMLHDTLEDR